MGGTMFLRLIVFSLCLITLTSAEEKKILDSEELEPPCYEPDPFSIDGCFVTCEHQRNHWDVKLGEVDFDYDLHATIFTYVVDVWEAGVCGEPIKSSSSSKESGNDKSDYNPIWDKSMDSKDSMNKMDKTNDIHQQNDIKGMRIEGDDILGMDTKMNEASGIEGFYIMFNGCCNNSSPAYFTKAVTPKLQ